MASISVERVTCRYPGTAAPALDAFDLRVGDGELLVLLGAPRSGKSTALRIIAGLEDIESGRVLIGERDVTRVDPKERDVAMVFQHYALYPHLSVGENMGFSLKVSGVEADEVRRRVEEAAEILALTPWLDAKPSELSSAQRQQVALARAVVRRPQVFLMDDPIATLDEDIRSHTRQQVIELQRQLGITTVYATADQVEAMLMADRVAFLDEGRLVQVGSARELYDAPATEQVARFIGLPPMNLLARDVRDGCVAFGGWRRGLTEVAEVTVGVRPEDLRLADDGAAAVVREQVVTDSGTFVRLSVDGTDDEVLALASGAVPAVGAAVHLQPDPQHVHVFHAGSGARL